MFCISYKDRNKLNLVFYGVILYISLGGSEQERTDLFCLFLC